MDSLDESTVPLLELSQAVPHRRAHPWNTAGERDEPCYTFPS
jgi:hypothetical protein